jgi:hypothetical protein
MNSNFSNGHTASILKAVVMEKYIFIDLVVKKKSTGKRGMTNHTRE